MYKYSDKDIKQMIKQLTVLIDSREKQNSHITDYLTKNCIPYETTTLSYGDYSCKIPTSTGDICFHDSIVIERKNSLEELSGNLTRDRERFEKEFLKAGNDGAKIYLIIEDMGGYSSIINHSYKTEFKPNAFMASLKTWESRFNCNVQFIDKQYAGFFILSTLKYFAKESLK